MLALLACLLLGAAPPVFAQTTAELLATGPPSPSPPPPPPPQLGALLEEPATTELDLEDGLPPTYAPWLEERLLLWRNELETLREQGRMSPAELVDLEKQIEEVEEAEVLHRLQTGQSFSPDQERALMRQVYSVELLLERLLTGLDTPPQAP